MIKTSIITVNYNSGDALRELMGSLLPEKRDDVEIIIIDNASEVGRGVEEGEFGSDARLIFNDKNVGFGSAVNQGFEVASGELFLLINPDAVVRPGAIKALEDFICSSSDVGIAGGRVLEADGRLQPACRRSVPTPWVAFCRFSGLSAAFPKSRLLARYNLTFLDENEVNEVDAVSGSFMMIKREVVEKIGPFDEDFFLYAEDMDVCYRAKKDGWKVCYCPDAVITHQKGVSASSNPELATYEFYNTMWTFHKKHFKSKTPFFINIPIYAVISLMKLIMPKLAARKADKK